MSYSMEKIELLTNEEIKNKVDELNKLQIKYIKESSLLNVIISLNAINRLKESKELSNENYKLESKRLIDIIDGLGKLLLEKDDKNLESFRKELLVYKNIIDGYLVELGYVGEIIDELGAKLLATKNTTKYDVKNVEKIIHLINHALDDSKDDYGKYSFIISEIIRVLPMRMITQNYKDIVRMTLNRNMQSFNEVMIDSYIENYKKQFDSSTRDGYGTKFDYYFMQIEKIKREDLESKDLNELSIFVKNIIDLTDELVKLKDFITSLGIITNLFIVLSKTKDIEINEQEILDEWILVSEKDKHSIAKYDKKLEKKLTEIEKELQESLDDYEKFAIELANREDFEHNSLDDDLLYTRSILAFYNDINFSDIDYLTKIDIEVANQDYILNSVDSLLEYIKRTTIDMPNVERKIRMRKLLSVIDLPFTNITEFENYIKYSLDNRVLEKDIINFKINQISYFLNEISEK